MSDGSAPLSTIESRLLAELRDAELSAWKALARYKFLLFGYWVGVWIHLNRIHGGRAANPWARMVMLARQHLARQSA